MNLTPRERDKLMIAVAAQVARARLARGVKLQTLAYVPATAARRIRAVGRWPVAIGRRRQ